MSSEYRTSSRYTVHIYVTCLFLCRTLYCAKSNYEFGISRIIKIYIYMLRVCSCAGLSTAPRVTMSLGSHESSRYTYICYVFVLVQDSTAPRVTMSSGSRESSRYTYIFYMFVVVQDSLLRKG